MMEEDYAKPTKAKSDSIKGFIYLDLETLTVRLLIFHSLFILVMRKGSILNLLMLHYDKRVINFYFVTSTVHTIAEMYPIT